MQQRNLSLWDQLTFSRVRVLTALEDGRTQREAAARIGITLNGARSIVDDLKQITGCPDVKELARWWRRNRSGWLAWCCEQAGLPQEDTAGTPAGVPRVPH